MQVGLHHDDITLATGIAVEDREQLVRCCCQRARQAYAAGDDVELVSWIADIRVGVRDRIRVELSRRIAGSFGSQLIEPAECSRCMHVRFDASATCVRHRMKCGGHVD
jgi:hypothetical protein